MVLPASSRKCAFSFNHSLSGIREGVTNWFNFLLLYGEPGFNFLLIYGNSLGMAMVNYPLFIQPTVAWKPY